MRAYAAKPSAAIGIRGFTLVEVLMAIAISALIMAALFSFYWAQQRTAGVQQDIAVLQQDLRGVAQMLTRDIRMAGFNPRDADQPNELTPPGFFNDSPAARVIFQHSNGTIQAAVTTGATTIAFTSDLNANGRIDQGDPSTGVPLEQIAYRFFNNNNRPRLQRYIPSGNGWQDVANDLDGIEFCYVLAGIPGCVTDPSPDNFRNNQIQAVWVSLLMRAPFPDQKYTDRNIYRPASCLQNPGAVCVYPATGAFRHFNNGQPYNDNFHRQMLSFAVQCRNIRASIAEIP